MAAPTTALSIEARRCAWTQLWRILLTPTPDVEAERSETDGETVEDSEDSEDAAASGSLAADDPRRCHKEL